MADIVVLGAGVMGSALAMTAAHRQSNRVTLAGSPLDDAIVDAVRGSRHHPTLDVDIPDAVEAVRERALDPADLRAADVVVIGVSSPGVDWAVGTIRRAGARPPLLALLTKGLVASGGAAPLSYADALPADLGAGPDALVGIGGPCIARELALGYPTRVVFASRRLANAERLRQLLESDVYRPDVSDDIVGVEACAALKNFLCIGISAMLTRHRLGEAHAKNPLAAAFNQGVRELATLTAWIKGQADADARSAAFDLAGVGDLHVTVGGGRNSRLGQYLGEGMTLREVREGPMRGVTVEGVDTGQALGAGFRAGRERSALDTSRCPLTQAILRCIESEGRFEPVVGA